MSIPVKAFRTGSDVTAIGEYAAEDSVPIEHGGTGATTLEDAQTALGIVDGSLLSAVALSGEYADLINLPTLGTAAATDASEYDPVGSATGAMLAHTTDFEHALIATALQPGDVADAVWGSITGSISSQTDLTPAAIGAAATAHGHAHTAITGLGTAATTAATAYATAAQGVRADTALQLGTPISTVSGLQAALDAKSATTHNHTGTYEPADATILKTANIGTSVCSQTDTRLSDARAPTAHGHASMEITGLGTAAAEDVEAFDASGAASAAVSGHTTAIDHTPIGTALQPTDIASGTITPKTGDIDLNNISGSGIQPGDDAADLGSGAATDGYVLTSDGAGGAAWEASAGGGGTWGTITGTISDQTDLTPAAIGAQPSLLLGYEESGSTLTQSAGALTIPVDGKTYAFMPSQAITAITTTRPTAPACSGCTVYVTQGVTGYAVAYPAAWRWPNGMATPISTVANSVTRLVLSTDPAGNVHADADVRSIV